MVISVASINAKDNSNAHITLSNAGCVISTSSPLVISHAGRTIKVNNTSFTFPYKSGTLKLGEDSTISIDDGSGALEYDLLDFNRIIITLITFDDNGHAVLDIYDNIGQEFSFSLDLINDGDSPVIEIFKSSGAYLIRASYYDRNLRGIKTVQGLSSSTLTFKFEGVGSSDRCDFKVEGFY